MYFLFHEEHGQVCLYNSYHQSIKKKTDLKIILTGPVSDLESLNGTRNFFIVCGGLGKKARYGGLVTNAFFSERIEINTLSSSGRSYLLLTR